MIPNNKYKNSRKLSILQFLHQAKLNARVVVLLPDRRIIKEWVLHPLYKRVAGSNLKFCSAGGNFPSECFCESREQLMRLSFDVQAANISIKQAPPI